MPVEVLKEGPEEALEVVPEAALRAEQTEVAEEEQGVLLWSKTLT